MIGEEEHEGGERQKENRNVQMCELKQHTITAFKLPTKTFVLKRSQTIYNLNSPMSPIFPSY